MVLGPLGIPGCAPLSYRGSLSSSPSPLPASPSARRAGTLTAAPQSASSPPPDRVQSRCSHFLRNRQFSAPLRVGHQRQSGPPADYCGASAAGNGGRRPPASSPRSQRPAGGGRAPPNLARRPCRRYRAPDPSSPGPRPAAGARPAQPQSARQPRRTSHGQRGRVVPLPQLRRSPPFVLETLECPGRAPRAGMPVVAGHDPPAQPLFPPGCFRLSSAQSYAKTRDPGPLTPSPVLL